MVNRSLAAAPATASTLVEDAPLTSRRQVTPYLDALRIAGAFAVVVIHVAGDGDSAVSALPFRSWLFCAFCEAASRWAVPIFVMVSGMLLLDPTRRESPLEFYRKRMRRVAVPAAFWSLFYLAWRWFYEGDRFSLGSACYQFISGGSYYHLWFFSMLLGLYVATPAIRVVIDGFSERQVWCMTGILFAVSIGDSVVQVNEGSDFSFLFQSVPFLSYFLLGHCLRSVQWPGGASAFGILAWLVGIAIAVGGTYVLVFHCATTNWDIDNRLYFIEEEFSPGVIVMSVGVFSTFAAWYGSRNITHSDKLLQTLSAATLGVYLTHPLFLSVLNAHDIDYEWHGVAVGVPICVLVASTGATVLTLLISKTPILKMIV